MNSKLSELIKNINDIKLSQNKLIPMVNSQFDKLSKLVTRVDDLIPQYKNNIILYTVLILSELGFHNFSVFKCDRCPLTSSFY